MKLTILISVFGLLVDVMGAYFLAKSFIRKQPEAIVEELTLYPGLNIYFFKSMLYQKVEAIAGFSLLFFGFLGQIGGYLIQSDLVIPYNDCHVVVLVFLAALALFFVLSWLTAEVSKWYSRKIIKHRCLENIKNIQDNEDSLIHWGKLLDIRRKKSESDKDYVKRVLNILKNDEKDCQ